MERVITDGDWGGDEMQLTSVLLAYPDKVSILGATATFGNTDLRNVTQNAGNILSLLGAESIAYYPGAKAPSGEQEANDGDNAHGQDGVGGVIIPKTRIEPASQSAAEFILETLDSEPEKTVSITATGPLTNLAQAYKQSHKTMRRVKEILVMGGCTEPLIARDLPERRGNITPEAEFNFYMAPRDAQEVMSGGLPIRLFPMNCTQQLSLTVAREKSIFDALSEYPSVRDAVIGMMKAPADLDEMKFGEAPFMHDVHTALYLVKPELYQPGVAGSVTVIENGDSKGRSDFEPRSNGNVKVMHKVNANDAFRIVLNSLKRRFNQ